jgi:hypothetical protein
LLSTITPNDWITNPVISVWIGIASLVIGIVAIIISVFTGYWFYHKSKPLKRITYDIMSDTPVVSIGRQVGRGKIKIEYEHNSGHSEEISDARLLTLKIWNTGNTDIKIWNSNDLDIEDMEEPIEFELDKRTVISLTEVKTNPPEDVILQKDLDTYLNKPLPSPNHLGLPHCLLQQKQSIELSLLVKGEGKKIKHRGKLINGKIGNFEDIIHERNRSGSITTWAMLPVFILVLICLLLLFPPISTINDYLIFTTVCTLLLLLRAIHRIKHPFTCTCEFKTLFSHRFKKHMLQTHHQYYY